MFKLKANDYFIACWLVFTLYILYDVDYHWKRFKGFVVAIFKAIYNFFTNLLNKLIRFIKNF